MSEQNPYKKNKILAILQESVELSDKKTSSEIRKDTVEPYRSTSSNEVEQFIYPHFDELDQILHRFKERTSIPVTDTSADSL